MSRNENLLNRMERPTSNRCFAAALHTIATQRMLIEASGASKGKQGETLLVMMSDSTELYARLLGCASSSIARSKTLGLDSVVLQELALPAKSAGAGRRIYADSIARGSSLRI
jgi:hypothetical protein